MEVIEQLFNEGYELIGVWIKMLFISKMGSTLVIATVLFLLRLVLLALVNRQVDDINSRYTWRKVVSYVLVGFGLLSVGGLWLDGEESLFTYLGLLSAGLAIALQGLLSNLFGWMFIISRRPFEVGDRIQIGLDAGDVVDIRLFEFSILEIGNWVAADQSTGRIIHIPNGKIFRESLANYNKGFDYIWDEIPVTLTFESDWEKAKKLLLNIVNQDVAHLSLDAPERIRKATRHYPITYNYLTPTVYTRVENHGVSLTLRFLCPPRQRRAFEQAIWEDILRTFAQHSDIEFAYPTQRFYQRDVETQ